jgi:hypothetical protein
VAWWGDYAVGSDDLTGAKRCDATSADGLALALPCGRVRAGCLVWLLNRTTAGFVVFDPSRIKTEKVIKLLPPLLQLRLGRVTGGLSLSDRG